MMKVGMCMCARPDGKCRFGANREITPKSSLCQVSVDGGSSQLGCQLMHDSTVSKLDCAAFPSCFFSCVFVMIQLTR